MIVETEYPEDNTYRRLDAGMQIALYIVMLIIFGWILIPLYTAGYIGEKLGYIDYEKEVDENV